MFGNLYFMLCSSVCLLFTKQVCINFIIVPLLKGNSLAVQWLGTVLFTARSMGSIPDSGELSSHKPQV